MSRKKEGKIRAQKNDVRTWESSPRGTCVCPVISVARLLQLYLLSKLDKPLVRNGSPAFCAGSTEREANH
jgi:hypothetical protein